MSRRVSRLDCGTRMCELAALLDADSGANDALAPRRAAQLRSHSEHCPYCQSSLESLRSLQASAHTVLDEQALADIDPGWVDSILQGLTLELQAGRSIPLTPPSSPDLIEQTEGSLRALLRCSLASDDSFVLGTSFEGDLCAYGAPVRVTLTVQTALGAAIPQLAQRIRRRCTQLIEQSTRLRVQRVDIIVQDIFTPAPTREASA